jgi:hypothetical protein
VSASAKMSLFGGQVTESLHSPTLQFKLQFLDFCDRWSSYGTMYVPSKNLELDPKLYLWKGHIDVSAAARS